MQAQEVLQEEGQTSQVVKVKGEQIQETHLNISESDFLMFPRFETCQQSIIDILKYPNLLEFAEPVPSASVPWPRYCPPRSLVALSLC